MSVEVKTDQLGEALQGYAFAYLITVSADAESHVVAVTPVLVGDSLLITDLGRRTRMNAADHPAATLVWPPMQTGGYSLIVDGEATLNDDGLSLRPSRAVLHRPAPRPDGAAAPSTGCESDCIEL